MTKPGSHSESPSAEAGRNRRIIIALHVFRSYGACLRGNRTLPGFPEHPGFQGYMLARDSYILRFRTRQKKEKFWILNLRPAAS